MNENRARQLGAVLSSAKARGTVLFFTGLGLTIHEAFTRGVERPSLYIVFAWMMGMPLVWGKSDPPAPPTPPQPTL